MESLMDIVGQNLRLTSSHKKQHLQKRCPDHQGLVLMDMSQKDPCQKQACEIQKCLQDHIGNGNWKCSKKNNSHHSPALHLSTCPSEKIPIAPNSFQRADC
ncbi:cx9C motif-containing protein 4 isoform X3 [Antechinus flavipes]|uniref:cx9C motif-containing protein 4 isoform X2 n=1 Tax=Antechinus flavipes TaxID=38775 RepID=UPI0022363947|nr:cx9C motif-containing protein 4 isoform X2 [Antechinus flavipes]XP_051824871.1 cx9C motif-containing protein 4 isoform X3 [Antechinus flavipes]